MYNHITMGTCTYMYMTVHAYIVYITTSMHTLVYYSVHVNSMSIVVLEPTHTTQCNTLLIKCDAFYNPPMQNTGATHHIHEA